MPDTTYVLTGADGVPVSIGTVIADPLPSSLTAHQLSDADAEALTAGTGRWDAETLTVAPLAPVAAEPDPITVLAEIGEALSTITPSSTSTALRTALLAMRAVIDNAVQA